MNTPDDAHLGGGISSSRPPCAIEWGMGWGGQKGQCTVKDLMVMLKWKTTRDWKCSLVKRTLGVPAGLSPPHGKSSSGRE